MFAFTCRLSHRAGLAAPGEARHFLHNLQSGVNLTGSSFCLSMAHGSILGKPTMVVASGIGPGTAALCVMELLQCRSILDSVSHTCLLLEQRLSWVSNYEQGP